MDDDILTRIDATTEERCACGCGVPLNPDGPSAWFATAACQQRWQGAQATDPQDVYSRPDAAQVYVGRDGMRVPLRGDTADAPAPIAGMRGQRVAYEIFDEWVIAATLADELLERERLTADRFRIEGLFWAASPPLREAPRREPQYAGGYGDPYGPSLTEIEIPGPPDDLPLRPRRLADANPPWSHATRGPNAWQRWCPHHRGHATPQERLRFNAVFWQPAAEVATVARPPTTVLACPVCGTIWPGPVMQAWWRSDRLSWVTEIALAAGDAIVYAAASREAARSSEMIKYAWAELERQLVERLTDRGSCTWTGCTGEARYWFRRDRPVPRSHRLGDLHAGSHLRVCYDHYADLLRDPIVGPGVRILRDR